MSFYTRTLHVGRTSIGVKVVVEAVRATTDREKVTVTEAEVIYVHVDSDRRPHKLDECSSGRDGPHGT